MSIYIFITTTLQQDTTANIVELFRWIDIADLQIIWSIRSDSLTNVMLVVVTLISTIVHIYSLGYMSHDNHLPRFMAYLSLFTFFMLMLITANDFIQLFFGWEGVGLSSYLLIGFWFKKDSAKNAAMKAFIVNRVGDIGLYLGIFAIYLVFGSLNFTEVFAAAEAQQTTNITFLGQDYHALTVICILLFIGAMGKSAQLGLHVWLPDAMEGPTPVSALIHAATMVTAGVFLVARCSYLFEYSEIARDLVTLVGALTCIFAASIAIAQNDIKKIIAYSTCSQLGYMFFALGVSAYSAGIFHLFTHAFFKALLFLCAGNVIHSMSHQQDINHMGGIWKKIKITYILMLIGSVAIAGIPPFAGFFSKDIVLEAAYMSNSEYGKLAYWFGVAAAFLTAFYSWRLIILVFYGQTKANIKTIEKVREAPPIMIYPLFILALGAVFAGLYGYYIGMIDPTGAFWGDSIFVLGAENDHTNPLILAHNVSLFIKYLPLAVGLTGILLAYILFKFYPIIRTELLKYFSLIHDIIVNKYYFDQIYNILFVVSLKKLGMFF
ncbi:MAG: NADH-quinone oxidoreductase subunit L, partial [Pseudomonadota bacterium]